MTTLLRIDASARTEGSHSRDLGHAYEAAWRAAHPGGTVVHRDLAASAIPQITAPTIAGFYTPADAMTDDLRAATALSDALIAELKGADDVLVTTPMYNFSIPAALKAWVDQIVRINATFSYDGTSFTGLVTGKRVTIAIAYGAGGYGPDGALAALDLVRPYLQTLFGFLGFTEVHVVSVEATTGDVVMLEAAMVETRRAIAALVA